jgi:hypothetical protein
MMQQTSPPPFLVMGLPRSRTAWLSKFLTYGPWICGHDQIRYFRTLEDVKSWCMQPFIGSAETIAPVYWRLINRYMPDGRVLIVRRPVVEVVESVLKQGIIGIERPKLIDNMRRFDAKLDQAEQRLPNCISINFDELNDPEICKIVFEHCLGIQFNLKWWEYWNQINVQVSFDAITRYVWTHMVQLNRLNLMARHQMMVDLMLRAPKGARDGLEIREESFDDSFGDAQGLAADHCMLLGEPPDEWTRNNIPLLQKMDAVGALQILTARANGKMFGYLVSMLGETLDSATARSATHTLFFASKEWPGAGLRLQREALKRLKEKGFNEVIMRSGLGIGARVETIYKRIGADFDGKIFRVKLEN